MPTYPSFIHGVGGYTTVGAAFAVTNNGSNNWTGAYNGVGDATLTWSTPPGQLIDAAESCTIVSTFTADSHPCMVAQADGTIQIQCVDNLAAAIESVVHFLTLRLIP